MILDILLLIVLFESVIGDKSLKRLSMQQLIRRKLMDSHVYKKQERPDETNTTMVMIYLKILAIDSVDVRQMQYSTDVYLRQVWVDSRLRWEHIEEFKHYNINIVSPSLKDQIWLPDLFFRNGKKGYIHNMTTPNYLMRVKPNGEVLYSQKLTMVFSCQMELQAFPMDTQNCEINIGSYGYTLEELKFYWRGFETIVVQKNLKIPEFDTPKTIETIDCTEDSTTSTGNYTCLKAIIELNRQLGSYLASTYIPSVLIIMVSWLNFWVSIDAVPARITLGLLSLLGIVNMAISMSDTLPRVSYIKAIDVWLIACIIFVIAALVEFAIATSVLKRSTSKSWQSDVCSLIREEINLMHTSFTMIKTINSNSKEKKSNNNRVGIMGNTSAMKIVPNLPPGIDMLFSNNPSQNEALLKELDERNKMSKFAVRKSSNTKSKSSVDSSIDNYSRFLFPACFLLYNCFYWLYYIILIRYSPKISK